MAYKQLDYLTRCRIYGLWKAGLTQTKIAKELGIHKSTISWEFKRNITFVRGVHGNINQTMPKAMLRPVAKRSQNKLNLLKKGESYSCY